MVLALGCRRARTVSIALAYILLVMAVLLRKKAYIVVYMRY